MLVVKLQRTFIYPSKLFTCTWYTAVHRLSSQLITRIKVKQHLNRMPLSVTNHLITWLNLSLCVKVIYNQLIKILDIKCPHILRYWYFVFKKLWLKNFVYFTLSKYIYMYCHFQICLIPTKKLLHKRFMNQDIWIQLPVNLLYGVRINEWSTDLKCNYRFCVQDHSSYILATGLDLQICWMVFIIKHILMICYDLHI